MERAQLSYVLLGAAAVGERRTREILATGARAAALATWPAARLWRSPLAQPMRRNADRRRAELAIEGEAFARRATVSVREVSAEVLRRVGDELAQSGVADELVGWLLGTGAFDRVLTVVINHPATEQLVVHTLDDPGIDRLLERALASRMADDLTARILASEQLQLVIDHVVASPELRAALTQQTAGLADDVAAGVRTRTVRADDAAERFARALLRRPRRPREAP
ncbi:MAG TPA: hypothetical protein VGI87_03385 [Solirubrobacteraceae bacterium]